MTCTQATHAINRTSVFVRSIMMNYPTKLQNDQLQLNQEITHSHTITCCYPNISIAIITIVHPLSLIRTWWNSVFIGRLQSQLGVCIYIRMFAYYDYDPRIATPRWNSSLNSLYSSQSQYNTLRTHYICKAQHYGVWWSVDGVRCTSRNTIAIIKNDNGDETKAITAAACCVRETHAEQLKMNQV